MTVVLIRPNQMEHDIFVTIQIPFDCHGNHCQSSEMTTPDPDHFDPERSVGYLTKRVFQLAKIGMEPVFQDEEVTHVQWSALMALLFDIGGTAVELARHLCHDTGATTRIIDTLEERGLIERCRCTDDRRVVRLTLTQQGRDVAERCRRKVVAQWNVWLSDWSHEDVEQFVDYLVRLRNRLETMA